MLSSVYFCFQFTFVISRFFCLNNIRLSWRSFLYKKSLFCCKWYIFLPEIISFSTYFEHYPLNLTCYNFCRCHLVKFVQLCQKKARWWQFPTQLSGRVLHFAIGIFLFHFLLQCKCYFFENRRMDIIAAFTRVGDNF